MIAGNRWGAGNALPPTANPHTKNPTKTGRCKARNTPTQVRYCAHQVNGGYHHREGIKRAALYVRVPTDQQLVESQIRELRQVAERRWQVAEVYRDAGISGAKDAISDAASMVC